MAVELKPGQSFDPRSLDLPSMGALVGFYHACLGFSVKQTWLNVIKVGNFDSLLGLTHHNTAQLPMKPSKGILRNSVRM